ncbi:hypothetical protein M2151_001160 [Lachnospiraceae bacterium PH1-22]
MYNTKRNSNGTEKNRNGSMSYSDCVLSIIKKSSYENIRIVDPKCCIRGKR